MTYRPPISDYQFLLDNVVGFEAVTATERFEDAGADVAAAILEEAGKLCRDVVAPLQRVGDLHPAYLENGVVRTAPGFADGYHAVAEGGWIGIAARPDHGGMGLPMLLATPVNEMLAGACLSLQIAPLLTQGQIEALEHHASDAIKTLYLPNLISGKWLGTMNLTEAQAGSDVGALTTKAEPLEDGTYAITGQKIYISWGDCDFAENVCHLVLARLPGAPDGPKGISLFLVPRHIPDPQGQPGTANALKVISLEHKMGLHGSPTCVMQYDGAKGWLVGAEGGGMAAMFTMMNNARLGVAAQGIGVAEAAYQKACAYARERKQGQTDGATGAIIDHADVRRMLLAMRADIFAARGIALMCAQAIDMANATRDDAWAARAAFLTPIAKAFGTDVGNEVAAAGIQVHGGMGFVEETGAAQFARDARVTTIYEGTNGIQAMDLVGRKMMDGGTGVRQLIDEIETAHQTAGPGHADLTEKVVQACRVLRHTTNWMLDQDMPTRFSGSVPYLRAFARVLGGHIHLTAARSDPQSPYARLARSYMLRQLPEVAGLLAQARAGSEDLFSLSADDFGI